MCFLQLWPLAQLQCITQTIVIIQRYNNYFWIGNMHIFDNTFISALG